MICSATECTNQAFARTWCRKHYMRWWAHGDVNVVKKVRPHTGAVNGFLEYAVSYTGDDCLLWPYSDNGAGYGLISVDGERMLVHRVICARINGPPPSETDHAAHGCGHGHLGCITPRHLRWATPTQNSYDKWEHGTVVCGEGHPHAKLTEEQVLDIFYRREPQTKIADEFSVSQTLVGLIKRGQRWGWLTGTRRASWNI